MGNEQEPSDLSMGATASAAAMAKVVMDHIQSGGAVGAGGGLTSFSGQPVTPRPLPVARSPQNMQQANRPGGYNTRGERIRDQKAAVFHDVAALVKSGSDLHQEKKSRALQMDIEQLMNASAGRTEAEAILKDPASTDEQKQEAQAALKKNTDIINDITLDPKKSKNIQKAFNINLLGESKNKAENAALFAAMKEFGKGGAKRGTGELAPPAQKLQDAQPQRMGMSPQAAAEAQAVKDKIKLSAKEQVEAMQKNVDSLNKANSKESEIALRSKIADQIAKLKSEAVAKQYEAALAKKVGVVEAARIHAQATIRRAQIAADAQSKIWDSRLKFMQSALDDNIASKEKIADEKLKGKNGTQNAVIKQFNEEYKEGAAELKSVQKDINDKYKLIQGLDKEAWWHQAVNIKERSNLEGDITALKAREAQVKGRLDGLDKKRQNVFASMQIPDPPTTPDVEVSSGGDGSTPDAAIIPDTKDLVDIGNVPQDAPEPTPVSTPQ